MAPQETPIPENSGRHFHLVIIFAWRHSYTVASKILTREQAQSRKDAAVRFAENVLDDPDKADDIESEDLDDWIDRKKITLIDNPKKRSLQVANGNGQTKQDLLD